MEKPFIFLSYNAVDRETVAAVRGFLAREGVAVFLDYLTLVPGLPWPDALQHNIAQASAVVVLLGKDGLGVWQKRELWAALDRQARDERVGAAFPVVPVLLPGAEIEKAPAFLLLNTYVDLRGGMEELDRLTRAIRGEAHLLGTVTTICPYRALRVFREEDAPLFFGREVFASRVWEKLRRQQLVAVVGPSGSGKSSVVQAGLLPALQRAHSPQEMWKAVLFTPGNDPFANLAAALLNAWDGELSTVDKLLEAAKLGKSLAAGELSLDLPIRQTIEARPVCDRLLLVIDQFEELFTLCSESDRKKFIEVLLAALETSPVSLVLTLRGDYYGAVIGYDRRLSDRIQEGIVNLGPMDADELRAAIVRPAEATGLAFQDGLVNRILADVRDEPGYLPLAEFALTELWEGRKGNILTHNHYETIGGATGALSARAESIYASLSVKEQELLLQCLSRLTRLSAVNDEGTDTRQRIELGEPDKAALPLIQLLVRARLVVVDRDPVTLTETVDMAHEALIRNWSRLRDFLNLNREFLLWRQNLDIRIAAWQRARYDAAALLSGTLLVEAKQYLRVCKQALNTLEQKYITESDKPVRKPARTFTLTSALVVGALLALGFYEYTTSNGYQIRSILDAAPDLLQSHDPWGTRRWMTAVVLAGAGDKAWSQTDSIRDSTLRCNAYSGMAEGFCDLEQNADCSRAVSQALAFVKEDDSYRVDNLTRLALLLARMDSLRELPEIIRRIQVIGSGYPVYSPAIFDLCDSLAARGHPDMANSIGSAVRFGYVDMDTCLWQEKRAAELARNGDIPKALGAVRHVTGNIYQNDGYLTLIDILIRNGQTGLSKAVFEEAIDSAFRYPYLQAPALTRLAHASLEARDSLTANRLLDSALAIASRSREGYKISRLIEIAQGMILARRTADADAIARWVLKALDYSSDRKGGDYEDLAKLYVGLGKIQEAIQLAIKGAEAGNSHLLASVIELIDAHEVPTFLPIIRSVPVTAAREAALVVVVKKYVQLGEIKEANRIINHEIPDDDYRSRAIIPLMQTVVVKGDYFAAVECADQMPLSAYKLSGLTAILLEEVIREHPVLIPKVKPLLAELDKESPGQ